MSGKKLLEELRNAFYIKKSIHIWIDSNGMVVIEDKKTGAVEDFFATKDMFGNEADERGFD